jgi:PadR family transcriptional regulator, regulatory protein PadR
MVNKMDTLGEFESLVLMAAMRLGRNAYGGSIHQQILMEAERQCTSGALYTTIGRLEKKGYLLSRPGEPSAERGGRAKNFLQVSESGKAALRESYASAQRLAAGIADLTLSSDVQKILAINDTALTVLEIVARLGKLGWIFFECDEPLKVLGSILSNLFGENLAKATTKDGDSAWTSHPVFDVKGALGERGNTLLKRGGFIDES